MKSYKHVKIFTAMSLIGSLGVGVIVYLETGFFAVAFAVAVVMDAGFFTLIMLSVILDALKTLLSLGLDNLEAAPRPRGSDKGWDEEK